MVKNNIVNMQASSKPLGTVYFIGAGPGDPELLTIKGHRLIAEAALVLYAGSLVPLSVVKCAHSQAQLVDSSTLTLQEIHALMRQTVLQGQNVARVHTGDPSIYGALREQIALLDQEQIPWQIIPGVTVACAAAAVAGISFTIPEISQSLIITRTEGRTPMPQGEDLTLLAAHGTALAIYLSGGLAEQMQTKLLAAGLAENTTVICVHSIGWPEQSVYWTTIKNMVHCIRTNNLYKQTICLILPSAQEKTTQSRLYAPDFAHSRRP